MTDLKQYFPMIQEREEVLTQIHEKKELSEYTGRCRKKR